MCRSPSGVHGGITLATQASPGSQLCIAFNSYNLVRVPRPLPSPCVLHWTRTPLRHQVSRPTRSRHSVLLSLILRRALLVMSAHRLCHCALSLPHTTLPQQTLLRNFLSRSFCSCVLPNTPSGAQFHFGCMKIFVMHRAPATLATQGKSLLPMPPRSSLLPSSSNGASSPKPSRRVLSPAPLCFKMHQLRLPHTVPLSQMHPPNSRSISSFLGASTPMSLPPHGHVSGPPLHQPKHTGTTHSISSSSGGDVRIPVPRTQPKGAPPLPPGLEDQPTLASPHGIPVKAAPVRPRSQLALGSASTALAGTYSAIGADPRAGRGPFPKPRFVVLPMVRLGLPSFTKLIATSCIINFVSLVCNGIQAQRAGIPLRS